MTHPRGNSNPAAFSNWHYFSCQNFGSFGDYESVLSLCYQQQLLLSLALLLLLLLWLLLRL
jgi:hypothetical protein